MLHKSKILISSLALIGVLPIAYAGGGGGMIVFDPTNFVKNSITALQTTQMVTQQIESYQTQLQQFQVEMQNIKNFPNFTWMNVSQTLANLANAIQTGQALGYSMQNMDAAFRRVYGGYQPQQNYQQSYQNWSNTTLDTIRGGLDSISMQAADFATEEQTINTLRGLANSPSGQMEAVQVGNMMSGEMLNQMQELRQLEMTQVNSQNTYMAYKVQKDQATQATTSDLVNNMNSNYPPYQNQNGFNKTPTFNNGGN